VRPMDRLSTADVAFLRAHRDAVARVLAYEADDQHLHDTERA